MKATSRGEEASAMCEFNEENVMNCYYILLLLIDFIVYIAKDEEKKILMRISLNCFLNKPIIISLYIFPLILSFLLV